MPSYQPNHCLWLCFTLQLHDGGSGRRLNDGLFEKTLTSGLGLDDMSLAWLAVVQLLVFIYSGTQ